MPRLSPHNYRIFRDRFVLTYIMIAVAFVVNWFRRSIWPLSSSGEISVVVPNLNVHMAAMRNPCARVRLRLASQTSIFFACRNAVLHRVSSRRGRTPRAAIYGDNSRVRMRSDYSETCLAMSENGGHGSWNTGPRRLRTIKPSLKADNIARNILAAVLFYVESPDSGFRPYLIHGCLPLGG